jgi:hypothetical protein
LEDIEKEAVEKATAHQTRGQFLNNGEAGSRQRTSGFRFAASGIGTQEGRIHPWHLQIKKSPHGGFFSFVAGENTSAHDVLFDIYETPF